MNNHHYLVGPSISMGPLVVRRVRQPVQIVFWGSHGGRLLSLRSRLLSHFSASHGLSVQEGLESEVLYGSETLLESLDDVIIQVRYTATS